MTTKPTDATAPPHDQHATDLQGAQDLTPSAWIGLGARFTGPRDLNRALPPLRGRHGRDLLRCETCANGAFW
jgi:hypothetical protein